jgi:4-hydroxy-4-methyl-2-oxoglutarate aldolase
MLSKVRLWIPTPGPAIRDKPLARQAAQHMTPKFSPTRPRQALSAETWSRALTLNPSVISDILHKRGVHQHVMRFDIQALDRTTRLCGIARTISSRPLVDLPQPGREYELLFLAIDGLGAGEILVTDQMDCCVWGELCSEAAMRRGSNGAIIDGFTRDSAEIRSIEFPLFCRGRHMSDLLYHRQITAIGEPVICGDVAVHPGDLVLGAEDGALVIPAGLIEEVVTEGFEKSQTESEVRKALRQGMSAGEAYRQFGVL